MRPKNTKKGSNSRRSPQKPGSFTQTKRHSDNTPVSPLGQNKGTPTPTTHRPQLPAPARAARQGLCLWGQHAVEAAYLNPDRSIISAFATPEAEDRLHAFWKKLTPARQSNVPAPLVLSRSEMDLMTSQRDNSQLSIHQGFALHVRPLDGPDMTDIITLVTQADDTPIRLLLLDQVTDPRNIGAILRSARAFGTDALIMTSRNAPEETGALARAAAGALEAVPIVRVTNLARALEKLKDNYVTLIGLDAAGTVALEAFAKTPHLGIILGSEGSGMRRLTREACDHITAINMNASSESLNVSVAAAIALYATRPQAV